MPAQIVLALHDEDFARKVANLVNVAGGDAATFSDPMSALSAFDGSGSAQVFIVDILFKPGDLNGIALALMARERRPQLRIAFVGSSGFEQHTKDLGSLIVPPVSPEDLASGAMRLLR